MSSSNTEELLGRISEFVDQLYLVANRDTAYPKNQSDWSDDNRFCGHCAIVVAMIHQKFGGKIMRGMLQNLGYSHYWNEIDGMKIDATKGQFATDEPIVDISEVQIDRILGNEETNNRFLLLEERYMDAFPDHEFDQM